MSVASTGSVQLAIAADHPAFEGHFPGQPIVPGAVLLDEALHAVGAAMGADLSACQISSVKFLSPVGPAEPVEVNYEITAGRTIRFDIVSGDRKVATASVRTPEAG